MTDRLLLLSTCGTSLLTNGEPLIVQGRAETAELQLSIAARPTVARYAVYGKPLCRIEDAVRFGERLRRAVMGRAKKMVGEERVPAVLSGHGAIDRTHTHAFYLPECLDAAGEAAGDRIHHALVYAPAGFDDDAVEVLDQLRRVATADGPAWQLVLEGVGSTAALPSPLLVASPEWVSVTPYLHPWHRKLRFDVADQIRRECGERGLPSLESIEPLAEVRIGGRARRPIHFHRFRSKRGLVQPDRQGSFWRLRFAEPVRGPIALGFACHFGLGLFAPAGRDGAPANVAAVGGSQNGFEVL